MAGITERAILAGGCFRGMQELLRHHDGVITTRLGYSGGQNENSADGDHPGHAEAVEVIFDPERTSYRDVLEFFFQIHDPTTRDRHGENAGSEYRSEIFCTNAEQRKIAEDTIADVEASGLWPGAILTNISDAGAFWEAEAEDQDYLQRYPDGATCHFPRPGWKLPRRYQQEGRDSTRWLGFPFRDGDIVISTPSKSGTTWAQMICALLIFGEPQLPAPLGRLSPWLDHLVAPREEVYALLAAQQHRRFIKTHTPLDGLPADPRATYLVTARHPLDVAVSWYHQLANFNQERWRQLMGEPEPPPSPAPVPEPLRDWLLRWIADGTEPAQDLDTLNGLMYHLTDAWARRREPNILLVHYDNLRADLHGQMRWLAGQLGLTIPERAWPALVRAARFENMSRNADQLIPAPGLFKSNAAFFRRGTSGEGREILSGEQLADYHALVAGMAPPDMLAWLHSPRQGTVTAMP